LAAATFSNPLPLNAGFGYPPFFREISYPALLIFFAFLPFFAPPYVQEVHSLS